MSYLSDSYPVPAVLQRRQAGARERWIARCWTPASVLPCPEWSTLQRCANEPDLAGECYQNVFGREIRRWDGPLEYWLITTGEDSEPGINDGLVHRESSVVDPTNIVEVPSLDEASCGLLRTIEGRLLAGTEMLLKLKCRNPRWVSGDLIGSLKPHRKRHSAGPPSHGGDTLHLLGQPASLIR